MSYNSKWTGPQIDDAVGKARVSAKQIDLTSIIATGGTNATGSTIASGTYFYLKGKLVRAKANIASGATFTSSNYEAVTAGGLNELKAALTPVLKPLSIATWGANYITDISHCWCYQIGNLVVAQVSCQIAATSVGWGGNLISGFPAPLSQPVFIGATGDGECFPFNIIAGALNKGSSNASAAGWYNAAVTYVAAT